MVVFKFFYAALLPKILRDSFHSAGLVYFKGAASAAVAAADAVGGVLFQLGVVVCRHGIANNSQIVVFVNQPDV